MDVICSGVRDVSVTLLPASLCSPARSCVSRPRCLRRGGGKPPWALKRCRLHSSAPAIRWLSASPLLSGSLSAAAACPAGARSHSSGGAGGVPAGRASGEVGWGAGHRAQPGMGWVLAASDRSGTMGNPCLSLCGCRAKPFLHRIQADPEHRCSPD